MGRPKRSVSITAVDKHVAARLREYRITRGVGQQEFADMLGITRQQLSKYENGNNQISAGRLFEIAMALSVPASYFYETADDEALQPLTRQRKVLLKITQNFAGITDERHLQAIRQLVRALARG